MALTQILIETVTLILILILLGRFPRRAEAGEHDLPYGPGRKLFYRILSVGVGATVTLFILVMTAAPHADRMGNLFLETTVELAEGTNAVNTILVDYRGFDTLGEITVLFVAVLAATSLPVVIGGGHLDGLKLLLHMMASGGLVFALPLYALHNLTRAMNRQRSGGLQRLGFWLLILAGLVSIATMFLCMLPLASTEQMHQLVELHR